MVVWILFVFYNLLRDSPLIPSLSFPFLFFFSTSQLILLFHPLLSLEKVPSCSRFLSRSLSPAFCSSLPSCSLISVSFFRYLLTSLSISSLTSAIRSSAFPFSLFLASCSPRIFPFLLSLCLFIYPKIFLYFSSISSLNFSRASCAVSLSPFPNFSTSSIVTLSPDFFSSILRALFPARSSPLFLFYFPIFPYSSVLLPVLSFQILSKSFSCFPLQTLSLSSKSFLLLS